MAQAAVDLYCHSCNQRSATSSTDFKCPRCQSDFVEVIEDTGPSLHETALHGEERMPHDNIVQLLTNSLFNSFPGVSPPDSEDSNSRSYFQIRLHSGPEVAGSTNDNEHSSQQPRSRRRYNFRIGRRGNRQGQAASDETDSNIPNSINMHPSMEEIFQQLFAPPGHDSGAMGGGLPWGMFPLHGNPGDYAWGSNGIDDIITQLLGQLDNAGAPPATADAIKTLPRVTITQEHVDKKRDCSVCMDMFVIDAEAKELPCEHIFHPDCIDQWLKLHNTCPICRTKVEESQQRSSCPRSPNHAQSNTSNPSTSGV